MALTGSNIIESIYADRALLIEPNAKMRSVYEEHLEFSGFEVHCAQSLLEAENNLEYLPVNLIVCNETAAGLNPTLNFIQLLREKDQKLAVILLSENEDELWDHIPETETWTQSFPIPHDLESFLKTDINQFISLVLMALDDMKCILLVNDSPTETAEMENLLINNYFRVCSVRDGLQGMDALAKAASTNNDVDFLVLDSINRYYPGFTFLSELAKRSIVLPSILLTNKEQSVESIKSKTNFDISSILSKSKFVSDLIPAIRKLI